MFERSKVFGAGGRLGRCVFASILVAWLAACEDPQPPAACGAIPQLTINAGEQATVTACFNDPNGDMLTFSVSSANPSVATASISGTTVTVTAVAPGNASVTVTASDVGGLQGQQSFQVMVPNRPPLPRGTISSITVQAGETESVDVASYFTEPDGEALTYSATSSNPAVATVSVSGEHGEGDRTRQGLDDRKRYRDGSGRSLGHAGLRIHRPQPVTRAGGHDSGRDRRGR